MYTSEQIDQIMNELGFDLADIKARSIVEQIANSKPEVAIDRDFISELRADIQARTSSVVATSVTADSSTNIFSLFMNRTLTAALVVLVVVAAGGAWYVTQNKNQSLFHSPLAGGGDQLLSGKYDVKSVPQESFGDLDKVAIVNSTDAAKLNAAPNPTSATGPGQGVGGLGGSAGISRDMAQPTEKMIAPGEPYPGMVTYTFNYTGSKDLPGVSATQGVLKRSKPEQPASLVSRILNLISFGLIDLNSMQNVKLQNFGFIEDREYGYGAYVDLQQGTVGMYQNYEKWPQMNLCTDGSCPTRQPLKPEELPTDNEAIEIAEQFLRDYSVSKEGYGDPRVVDMWRNTYERLSSAEQASYYVPEQVQVVYPLVLDGKEVYDEGGNVYGLNVMVDARTRRVTNLGELITKQFERSEYKGETDINRLLSVATNGGFRNYNYENSDAKKVELQLGSPTVRMVKIYYSSDNYRTNSDLYMPALVFPITNWRENNYWRQTVIVPLVKSILDTDQQKPIPILDKPIPVEPDGGNGSSSSNPDVPVSSEPALMKAQ